MKVFLYYSLMLNFIISKLLSTIEWDEDSLYNYTSTKIRNRDEELYYIIIDPDEILNKSAKKKILEKMQNLYTKESVLNYIIIFNKMNKTIHSLDKIVYFFNLKMENGFPNYKRDNVLISAFAIDARLSRITTGENVRNFISDNAASKILNNRKTELRNKNYDKAMEDQIDDIFKYYGHNSSRIIGWIFTVLFLGLMCGFFVFGCILCRSDDLYNYDGRDSSDWGINENKNKLN